MKMIKKLVTVIMALGLIMSTFNPVYAETDFSDVPTGAWYESHVKAVADSGIIVGNGKGQFMPDTVLTVDQFVKTMVVAVGHNPGNGEDYWASEYLEKARELGIIDEKEYLTQEYSTMPITRGQMAKICEKTLNILEGVKEYTKTDVIREYIPDSGDVEKSGYRWYIYHVYEIGIITGDSNGAFHPGSTLTRAEAATVIHRMVDGSQRQAFVEKDTGYSVCDEEEDQGDCYYRDYIVKIDEDFSSQYKELEEELLKSCSKEITDEVVSYVKGKTVLTQSLESRRWEEGKLHIRVSAQPYSTWIVIQTWEYY